MPAWLEEALVWFWAAWGLILFGFLLWAMWVFVWDEPRKRRRTLRRLEAVTRRPRDGPETRNRMV